MKKRWIVVIVIVLMLGGATAIRLILLHQIAVNPPTPRAVRKNGQRLASSCDKNFAGRYAACSDILDPHHIIPRSFLIKDIYTEIASVICSSFMLV